MEMIVIIVLGIVILAILAFVVMWLIARSKGKIYIQMDKYDFAPGDTIKGKVILNLKKEVDAKSLNVGLIGYLKRTSFNREGNRRNKKQVIFNFSKPLDGEHAYASGEKAYDFTLKIPKDVLSKGKLGSGVLGNLVKGAEILTGNVSSISWYVKCNLEIKGFDIRKEQQITIG